MEPDEIYKAFTAALLKQQAKIGWGFGAELARKINKSPQYVDKLLKGKSYGTEALRRKIARVLGYDYESFIGIGPTTGQGRQVRTRVHLVQDEAAKHQTLYEKICQYVTGLSLDDKKTVYRMVIRFAKPEPEASRKISEDMKQLG